MAKTGWVYSLASPAATSRSTSSPAWSAVASGPIACPKARRQARSTSSARQMPVSTRRTASRTKAMIRRVVTKPGRSFSTTTQLLPIPSAKERAAATVASVVSRPRTISHSSMRGTGEKKCVPTTEPGRPVAAAISVTGMPEVLVASRAPGGQSRSSSAKTRRFRSTSSATDSTATAQPATSPRSVVVRIRASVVPGSSARAPPPRAAARSREAPMPARARRRVASRRLWSTTSCPAAAATWASPAPMTPAPTTATGVLLSIVIRRPPSLSGAGVRRPARPWAAAPTRRPRVPPASAPRCAGPARRDPGDRGRCAP